ncbi:hypothetical protein FH621_01705 [Latilactobacillus curvatus]|uniref:hypothetical protein n=1 Tax=Latilactobacillus curvatus TaxID=28038 RepID=UPI00217E6F44|nr:hypothetical protein [Latilactobacillus curvatus]MCS6142277.1 hypothetical protein [Latilactobacillus curvatus]
MNKDEFNKIFDHNMDLASNEFWSQEKIQERIDHFSDENGKLDMNRFGAFLADQSREYTEKFTYNLLFDLLVGDATNDSAKDSESI